MDTQSIDTKSDKNEKEINRFAKQSVRVNIPIIYSYMNVQLILANNDLPMEEDLFASACLNAITPIFGKAIVSGTKYLKQEENNHNYDIFKILKYDKENKQAILQIQTNKIKQVWGCFTMCTTVGDTPCKFEVKKVSSFLSYVLHGSRQQ